MFDCCGVAAWAAIGTSCSRRGEEAEAPIPPEPPRERPGIPDSEPLVRVRVKRHAGGPITIGRDGQWLRFARPESLEDAVILAGPLMIELLPGGWSVVDGGGVRAPIGDANAFAISGEGGGEESFLAFDDRVFPGALWFHERSGTGPGRFDVVNHVLMESYLPGVLARELFPQWDERTFAAMAIAARSFAAAEAQYFKMRRAYDLTDTQRSQVYGGSTRNERALEATAETDGVVLTWEGALVPGYYSSCCGGRAARAVDAIGDSPINDVAPLDGRSVPDGCENAPRYRWDARRSIDDITRRLMAFGDRSARTDVPELSTIKSVKRAAANAHGRPTHYSVTDRTGPSFEIGAEALMRAFNHAGQGFKRPRQALWSSDFEVQVSGGRADFSGRGFGHGAGLCQYGARARGRDGETHQAILDWYYPGASLVKGW